MDGSKHVRIKGIILVKTEAGFILPVVMITIFFFSAFLLFLLSQYTLDQKFIQERELLVKEDALKRIAAMDIIGEINQTTATDFTSQRVYPMGSIQYHVTQSTKDEYKVEGTLAIPLDHRGIYQFIYNKTTDKIVKWVD